MPEVPSGGGVGVGESPNTSPARGLGKGGLPMKKKIYPKSSPKKLKEKVGWKKSFNAYKTGQNLPR